MGRKNHRGRAPQARRNRVTGEAMGRGAPPASPIEKQVLPSGRCHYPHRKLKFAANNVAKALEQAKARRNRLGQRHTEERFYECETAKGGCGGWHLTSRKEWMDRS